MPDLPAPHEFDHQCWQHAWLHADGGWHAFEIWSEARWDPLAPLEQLEFALRVGGYPDDFDWVVKRKYGRVQINPRLDVHAYTHDPKIPHDMKRPHVIIGNSPLSAE